MEMIASIINNDKRTEGIRGYLLYWILGISYIEIAVLLSVLPVDNQLKFSIVFNFVIFLTGIVEIVFSCLNRQILSGWNLHLGAGIVDLFWSLFIISYSFKTMVAFSDMIALWVILRSYYCIKSYKDLSCLGIGQSRWYRIFNILAIVCCSSVIIWTPLLVIFDTSYIINFALICMAGAKIIHYLNL